VSKTADPTIESWLLPRLWGLCLLLLVAGTFRLWFSLPGTPNMPMIPLVQSGMRFPSASSLIPSTTLVVGLLVVVVSPGRFRRAWWLVAASFFASFFLDQHRLQPWAYQGAIYALIFASMDQPRARRYLIPLAASVYVYSAVGKFDFQFAHTVGQDFLSALAQPLGGLPESLDQLSRAKIALLFPTMELLAGIGLLFRRTRPLSAVVVILMHASLVAILGPWGLDHSAGVLIWNLSLIVQAYLLMLKPDSTDSKRSAQREQDAQREPDAEREPDLDGDQPQQRGNIGSLLVRVIVVGALVAPVFERWGYWDHWPSWSLYSPHTSRVEIELHRSAIDSLHPDVRSYLQEDANQDGWQQLEIERWSLASRGVPIYPQARYQLALAEEIAIEHQLQDEIRAQVKGVSDRWTGRRDKQLLLGRREIEDCLKSYWLMISPAR
jgi:hypothetical protein